MKIRNSKLEIRNLKFETNPKFEVSDSGLGVDEGSPILFTDYAYEGITACPCDDRTVFVITGDVLVSGERLEARVVR